MIFIVCKNIEFETLFFEDILTHFGITLTPNELLKKYKKFTFQTLKKFYTMLYSDANKFLVLDSESMWIKETYMKDVFDNFFNSPFISGSSISQRKAISPFTQGVIDNVNFLINQKCDKWFLENFVWFYDKNILNDLFEEFGTPIEMAEKVYNQNDKQLTVSGIFDIELCQAYLYKNLEKYDYKYLDVNNLLENCLTSNEQITYLNRYNEVFDGNCGLFEHTLMLLNEINYKPLAETFKNNHYNIIRCDYSDMKNIEIQEEFINIVQPNILAASQEHAFGINDKFKILVQKNKYSTKLEKHIFQLTHPNKYPFQLIIEPFAIVKYWLKWYFCKQKNIKRYKELYE